MKPKKNSNRKKKDPQEKLIEKVLRSMDNNNPVAFERIPDVDHDPFMQPIAELPTVSNSFYFEELLSWMYNGYQQKKCAVYTDQDFITRHETFPPEVPEYRIGEPPYEQKWDSMTLEDLALKEEAARDRIYFKSPALHVFLLSILERIKGSPDEFITAYAKHKSITNLLKQDDTFKGEYKCIELLTEELETYLNLTDHQLIPTLYHFRDHGFIMSDNFQRPEKQDVKVTPEYTYEFGFSKQTSDNFIKQLITVLQERKRFIQKINKDSFSQSIGNNDKQDNRISCKADKEDIRNYFLKLTHKDQLGQPIMSEADVTHLLHANFTDFEPRQNIKKFNPAINQANLRYFVYQFYQRHSKNIHEAEVYANFLKNNFSAFDNTTLSVIKKKFALQPAKYPSFLI